MAISPYVRALRDRVGPARLLLPSVAALVYDDDGRLLLVRQRDGGVWSTPGGSMEPDETPADAVVRETWEETGLLVEPRRVAGVYGGPEFIVRYPGGDQSQYVMIVFECAVVRGEPRPDGDETLEVRYWRADEAAALPLSGWLRTMIGTFFARPASTHFHPPAWGPG
ncbi:MAG TPA: NUDIX domain-containing protein [Longimicrobium sp.]